MEKLKTGDVVLFSSNYSGLWGYISKMIKWSTESPYTHVGMVLKDPTFINPSLKGLYLWQSGKEVVLEAEEHTHKFGVQITPLRDVIDEYKRNGGTVYYRSIDCDISLCFDNNHLSKLHKIVHNKPYDIYASDWIEAFFRKDDEPQKDNRFWCSAFVGYIYTKCGILEDDIDWSILRPSDFSLEYDNQFLYFKNGYKLEPLEIEL
jgi:hypothetical protein